MASKVVVRSTMMKVPDPANIEPILQKYATLKQDARKDGQPYILEVTAGKTIADPRNQGYSILAITRFASVEDMKYYDEACEAHQALKALAKGKVEPPPLPAYMSDFIQT